MFENISPLLWIVGPVVGLFGMFAGGYWGVGCGWLIVPVMLLLGLTPMEAVGIALLQMVPSTLPTVIKTANQIPWGRASLGRAVVIPMGVGALMASFAGRPINEVMYQKFGSSALMILFACVMVVIGLQTALSHSNENQPGERTFSALPSLGAWLAGLATGVFSSVLGVGGAVLMRPALASGFKVPEKETSVAIRILLLVTTLSGGATYLFRDGAFQWRILCLTLLIAVGGMVGFPLGVRLHNLVAKNGYTQHIHKSFACIAVIVISSTILKLCHLETENRILMIVFALLLTAYLLLFGYYTTRHPQKNA